MLKSDEKLIREGDIIISSANSWNLVGKCCQAQQDFPDLTFGGFVTNMRPKAGKADARFIYHLFSSPDVQRTVRSFGRQTTSISNLDLNRTKALEIPLPPLEEQRRIAGILDAADALRRRRSKALALLDTLPGAIFAEMFGDDPDTAGDWPVKKFGDLITDNLIGLVRGAKEIGPDLPVPYLKMDSITRGGRVDLEKLVAIDASSEEVAKYSVAPGDLRVGCH